VYPLLFHQVETGNMYPLSFLSFWFFAKNWMFITVLCIMFDIKDYAADYNRRIKTFVVQAGLRKTIFYIIIPLCLLGFISYIIFVSIHHFPLTRILFNCVPFILLIIVAYSLHRRKPILYYLAVIDGLMLVKAACGILGVLLVK
jgi:4-hydroxybenzoate polyprenyltransferase